MNPSALRVKLHFIFSGYQDWVSGLIGLTRGRCEAPRGQDEAADLGQDLPARHGGGNQNQTDSILRPSKRVQKQKL